MAKAKKSKPKPKSKKSIKRSTKILKSNIEVIQRIMKELKG
jgi:hypothetical protein